MATEKSVVDCGDALTISNATELHRKILKALQESSTIELVADSVERVDTAGIQLVLALSDELKKIEGSMIWKDPSSALIQATNTAGVMPYMGFDQ